MEGETERTLLTYALTAEHVIPCSRSHFLGGLRRRHVLSCLTDSPPLSNSKPLLFNDKAVPIPSRLTWVFGGERLPWCHCSTREIDKSRRRS